MQKPKPKPVLPPLRPAFPSNIEAQLGLLLCRCRRGELVDLHALLFHESLEVNRNSWASLAGAAGGTVLVGVAFCGGETKGSPSVQSVQNTDRVSPAYPKQM